jgi:hypothetical protein
MPHQVIQYDTVMTMMMMMIMTIMMMTTTMTFTPSSNAHLTMPGMTMVHMGRIFRKLASTVAPLPCGRLLAASTRCTITMSVHQYHVLESICPNKKPALHRHTVH